MHTKQFQMNQIHPKAPQFTPSLIKKSPKFQVPMHPKQFK